MQNINLLFVTITTLRNNLELIASIAKAESDRRVMSSRVEIFALTGLPLINPGDDLAGLIVKQVRAQGLGIENGDIIVIGQKAVSKTEGRLVDIDKVSPSRRALDLARKVRKRAGFVEIVLRDSKRIARASRQALIVTTKHGFTCLNGGVDKSNVEGERMYALLPVNPDLSARKIRTRIQRLTKRKIGLLITDTHSRPFRLGQVEETIGVAGLDPLVDYRGKRDLFGYKLRFKNVAIADELAAAAELVMGQGTEATPVAIIRGLGRVKFKERARSSQLVVAPGQDLFKGTL